MRFQKIMFVLVEQEWTVRLIYITTNHKTYITCK